MKHFLDRALQGHALVADNATDLIDTAVKASTGHNAFSFPSSEWLGHYIPGGWGGLAKAFHSPWLEGTGEVERCLYELQKDHELPEPRSVRRRGRWSEEGGELYLDRLMEGEEAFYRETKRQTVLATRNVCLLCHTGGAHSVKAADLFWRGAACIAVVDMLERAGFSCEVWLWSLSRLCYKSANHWSFVCSKIKEAGSEAETDLLTKMLSGWFFRTAVIGAKGIVEDKIAYTKKGSHGYSYGTLGDWIKYLDLDNTTQTVQMPVVWDRPSALKGAGELLSSIGRSN